MKAWVIGLAWLSALTVDGCGRLRSGFRPKTEPEKEDRAPAAATTSPATQPATKPAVAQRPLTRAEARKFVDAHTRLDSFQGWKDDDRRAAVGKALRIAEQFKGTDVGARALMTAAAAYTGQCELTRPLGEDGWDRAIALYQRVVAEYPDTPHAPRARWLIAGCHGCWGRWGCCRFNQGKGPRGGGTAPRNPKQDWAEAIRLYEELHQAAADPGSKCDALRRIAEIQCNCLGAWREGLATYRRIVREFPDPPPASPYPTNRTCGPLNGTHLLDFDIVEFTHQRLLAKVRDPQKAIRLRDEFDRLAPQRDTIRFHTLYQLEQRLRLLRADKEAGDIQSKLGLCETWLVVGPFNGGDPTAASGAGRAPGIPADLVGLRRLSRIWPQLPGEMRSQIRTAYAPEQDALVGKIDLTRPYRVFTAAGREGKALWIRPSGPMLHKTWAVPGALYALTYVDSPKAQDARLRVALSGFARVWLNGKSVLATDVLDYPVMDQHVGPIHLRAGKNELLVKLAPWDRSFRSYVRITGELGWALPGLGHSVPQVPAGNRAQCDFLRAPAGKGK